jgi:hypothetical protein
MQTVPINDAEGIIEAFWDPTLSDLACYHFCPGEDVVAKITQTWWCSQLSWQKAKQGKTIFTMSRDVSVSLAGYDAIRIRCGVPSSVRVTLKAIVDGHEQMVLDGITGENKKWEYTGPVAGKRLEQLTIVCEAIKDCHGGGTLQWISLVNQQIEQVRQSRKSSYTPDWPKLLFPVDHPVEMAPTLGLLYNSSGDVIDGTRRVLG